MELEKAYEVEKLEGKVTAEVCRVSMIEDMGGKKRPQFCRETVEADAGYMVYFPRGHSIRVATAERLAELGFTAPAPLIDMESGAVVPGGKSLKNK